MSCSPTSTAPLRPEASPPKDLPGDTPGAGFSHGCSPARPRSSGGSIQAELDAIHEASRVTKPWGLDYALPSLRIIGHRDAIGRPLPTFEEAIEHWLRDPDIRKILDADAEF